MTALSPTYDGCDALFLPPIRPEVVGAFGDALLPLFDGRWVSAGDGCLGGLVAGDVRGVFRLKQGLVFEVTALHPKRT